MAKRITRKMLEEANYWNSLRGNMGYVDDPGGPYNGRQKGYVYGYRCVEYPRVMILHRIYLLDDAAREHIWHVDGDACRDIRDACQRLAQPPALTLWEYVCWTRLPAGGFSYSEARDHVAGCINPTSVSEIDSPWSRASSGIEGLRDKGMIVFKQGIGYRATDLL